MSNWGVPSPHSPIPIAGGIGILTSFSLQVFSKNGEHKQSLKLANKVIACFSNGTSGAQRIGLITETDESLDLTVYDSKCVQVSHVQNVADLTVITGTISQCGNYATIITGLPDFKIKVFDLAKAEIKIEHDLHVSPDAEVHHCPQDWRKIAVKESSLVTLLQIEVFEEMEMLIVKSVNKISELRGKVHHEISSETEKLWEKRVNELILNCEELDDETILCTSILWFHDVLLISTSLGEIFSLPNGKIFFGPETKVKNALSLEDECNLVDPGMVESMVALENDEILICGNNKMHKIYIDQQKKGKKKTKNSTIHKLDLELSNNPERIMKISDGVFLICSKKENGFYNAIVDIQTEKEIFNYEQCTSLVNAVCPTDDNCILVARKGGLLQLVKSEITVLAEYRTDYEIVEIHQSPVENIYLIGTGDGFLVLIQIDKSSGYNFKVLAATRIFKVELSFISVDPFGRGIIVASKANDKIIVLSWKLDVPNNIALKVIGYVSADGVVRSISVSSTSPTNGLHVLASISETSAGPIDAAITFELSTAIFLKDQPKYLSNLLEFEPTSIKSGFVQLPPLSTIFMTACISNRVTCFASSVNHLSIYQIEFTIDNVTDKKADFGRSLNKVKSHNVVFAVPIHGLWVATVCRSGLLQFTRNISEKIVIPSTEDQYKLKFNHTGDMLIIYTKKSLQVMQLNVKKETELRVKDFRELRSSYLSTIFSSSPNYDSISFDNSSETCDWFENQVQVAVREENKKFKDAKQHIGKEILDLQKIVADLLETNIKSNELEQLDNQEFNLDLEAHEKFKTREISVIENIINDVAQEIKNGSKIIQDITHSYWDELKVRPKMVKNFTGLTGISNYKIDERKAAESVELEDAIETRKQQMSQEEENRRLNGGKQDDVDSTAKEDPINVTGTLSNNFLPPDNVLESQFKLKSLESRQLQLIFIEDRIRKLKKYFNGLFDQSYTRKETELGRISEYYERIMKIQVELGLQVESQVYELDVWEKPEIAFVVKDEEVKVQRVLSDKQQEQLENDRNAEEQRRIADGDDWRDRGLKEMMDGVLEVKKEDVLKHDIPIPDFMLDPDLHESDWSEEQKKTKIDYDKRVKQLNEDRLKHKKGLEAENKKLQQLVKESISNYNNSLAALTKNKILIDTSIHQEELRMLRLSKSIEWKLQADKCRTKLDEIVIRYRSVIKEKSLLINKWKLAAENKLQMVDSLAAEEKVTEKQIKVDLERKFQLSTQDVDCFLKIYKRRSDDNIKEPELELDLEPETTEEILSWVQQQRGFKLISEANLKNQMNDLNMMTTFINQRQAEVEDFESLINDLMVESEKNLKNITKSEVDLLVQLLLKQGQVEINIYEKCFTESIFVHKEVVEDLNSQIKQYGQNKIDAMLESKEFRKDIHMLEWERGRLEMEMQDLTSKAHDIQMLKLTRELQSVLSSNTNVSTATQLSRIDKTVQSQNEQHQKKLERKKYECTKLTSKISEFKGENCNLEKVIDMLQISVSERRNIRDTHIQSDTKKIMRDIARRRKLVEISKTQQNEIAVLRNELERLRKKTFPALVKIER